MSHTPPNTRSPAPQTCGELAAAPGSAFERLKHDLYTGRLAPGVAADVREVLELAEIGMAWRKDSSLEKWFPFTSKTLVELKSAKTALNVERSRQPASEAKSNTSTP